MAISVSMQMEAGAQPSSGAESPMPKIDPKYPDLPATKWYQYGYKEGLPRLMDMFDRRQVKVTSHMVGAAVDLHPALAKEIVQRGHEAAGHGQTWTPQFSMTPEQERESYKQFYFSGNLRGINAINGRCGGLLYGQRSAKALILHYLRPPRRLSRSRDRRYAG
jgi:peptidoglycan/xylan/chitin deacetylase (PgdA/CDA1 family)